MPDGFFHSVVPEGETAYADIDTSVAHIARVYDYWLGGKDNFAPDREAGDEAITAYLDADVRDPDSILRAAADVLDFSQPVAVMLVAILHFVSEDEDPGGIIARFMADLPPGSSLTISHVPSDMHATAMKAMGDRLNRLLAQSSTYRSREQVTRFFDGLELVPPGVVPIQEWRPSTPEEAKAAAAMWGGVALKR